MQQKNLEPSSLLSSSSTSSTQTPNQDLIDFNDDEDITPSNPLD